MRWVQDTVLPLQLAEEASLDMQKGEGPRGQKEEDLFKEGLPLIESEHKLPLMINILLSDSIRALLVRYLSASIHITNFSSLKLSLDLCLRHS